MFIISKEAYKMDIEKSIIDFACPYCGNNKSEVTKSKNYEYGMCTFCNKRTFYKDLIMKTAETYQPVRCPYCNSTSVSKITNTQKAGLTAIFGIFAIGKTTKQWHCGNCDSDF